MGVRLVFSMCSIELPTHAEQYTLQLGCRSTCYRPLYRVSTWKEQGIEPSRLSTGVRQDDSSHLAVLIPATVSLNSPQQVCHTITKQGNLRMLSNTTCLLIIQDTSLVLAAAGVWGATPQ